MSHWATDTVYLAAVHFIAGIIGFFYRLFLSNQLGPKGMGIYQQNLAFYTTAITIITAGIPLSVSKLVAEHSNNSREIKTILSSAYILTSLFSIIGSIYLILMTIVIKRNSLLLILPASILVGVSSILKGYFLGMQKAIPVRLSILAESLMRTLLGFYLINSLILVKVEKETLGAITALAFGELTSLIVLVIYLNKGFRLIKLEHISLKKIKSILYIIIPISLSQIIASTSLSVEALLIPRTLQILGLSLSDALATYGKTSGMVLPLLFFPAIFIMSLSSNIIPQMARALSQNNLAYAYKLCKQALMLSTFFAFSVAGIFVSLANPIGKLLFKNFDLHNLIICFAVGIPFFYTENILRALLRAIGNNKTPLISSVLSFFITNGILYLLVPNFGITGYAIALITASIVEIAISISTLENTFDKRFNMVDILIKPLLCCGFMIYILTNTYKPLESLDLPEILCIGADILLGLSAYIILALAMGLDIKSN